MSRKRRRQRALVQVPGAHHRHRELHDLGRLEADDAEVEPALRALADVAGERDDHEQHEPERVGRRREHAQEVVRHLRQQDEEREADADARELVEPERRVLARRAVEHEQAEAGHGDEAREQHAVELAARCSSRAMPVTVRRVRESPSSP